MYKDRERGYYWIKLDASMGWEVAFYDGKENWKTIGSVDFVEENFHEIDERQIIKKVFVQ
jgi:hypothetical protein